MYKDLKRKKMKSHVLEFCRINSTSALILHLTFKSNTRVSHIEYLKDVNQIKHYPVITQHFISNPLRSICIIKSYYLILKLKESSKDSFETFS